MNLDIRWDAWTHWDREVRWTDWLVAAPTVATLDRAFVRDQHLRVTSGTVEDDYIDTLISAAASLSERFTRRAHAPQDRKLTMDRFPIRYIRMPMPPLIEVTSIAYVDTDGVTRTLTEGTDYIVSAPVGPTAPAGRIEPAYGTCWPIARCQLDSVTVTYRAGYADLTVDPPAVTIPQDILHGQLLVIGELYKQRSLSVQSPNNTPAILRAEALWMRYRVY